MPRATRAVPQRLHGGRLVFRGISDGTDTLVLDHRWSVFAKRADFSGAFHARLAATKKGKRCVCMSNTRCNTGFVILFAVDESFLWEGF